MSERRTTEGNAPDRRVFAVKGQLPEYVHYYSDAEGAPVGAVARFSAGTLEPKKTCRQYRFESGDYRAGLDGASLPIYRLPDVYEAINGSRPVFVVEGEKCVDRLAAEGLAATTNPGGALKWKAEHTEALRGANVFVLPDNDGPGLEHGLSVVQQVHEVTESVKLVEISGLPEHGDVVDFLDAGQSVSELLSLCETARLWTPAIGVEEEWPSPQPFGANADGVSFPVGEALPVAMAEHASAVAAKVKIDVAVPGVLGPVVLSAAAGNTFRIQVSRAYAEPNLARYAVVVVPSGERKSAVFASMVAPLEAYVQSELPGYEVRLREVACKKGLLRVEIQEAERRAAKATEATEREQWRNAAREARASLPADPRRPLAYLGDITQQALVRAMALQGGGAAVLCADARQVVDGLLGQYRRDGATDDSVYLRAHGGDQIDRARVGDSEQGELVLIASPSLALGLCIQRDKFEQLACRVELAQSGCLARCNAVQPVSLVGTRFEEPDEPDVDAVIVERWEQMVRRVMEERFRLIDEGAEAWPRTLRLAEDAMEARRAYANELEGLQAPGELLESVAAFASKATGETARLAGLFHLAEMADARRVGVAHEQAVSLETWMRAEVHQRWQLSETLRCIGLARESDEHRVCRRILNWATRSRARGVVSSRDIVGSRIVETADEAATRMGDLEQLGWVRRVAPKAKELALRWEFHPQIRGGEQS